MELLNAIIDSLINLAGKKNFSSSILQEQYPVVCLTISEFVRNGFVDHVDSGYADILVNYKTEKEKKK